MACPPPYTREDLVTLLKRYYQLAQKLNPELYPLSGGELVLPPREMKLLVRDLQALGVPILGLDGWRFWNSRGDTIVQDLGVFFDTEMSPEKSPFQYIDDDLPKDIDLVSIGVVVPIWWELFPHESLEDRLVRQRVMFLTIMKLHEDHMRQITDTIWAIRRAKASDLLQHLSDACIRVDGIRFWQSLEASTPKKDRTTPPYTMLDVPSSKVGDDARVLWSEDVLASLPKGTEYVGFELGIPDQWWLDAGNEIAGRS